MFFYSPKQTFTHKKVGVQKYYNTTPKLPVCAGHCEYERVCVFICGANIFANRGVK